MHTTYVPVQQWLTSLLGIAMATDNKAVQNKEEDISEDLHRRFDEVMNSAADERLWHPAPTGYSTGPSGVPFYPPASQLVAMLRERVNRGKITPLQGNQEGNMTVKPELETSNGAAGTFVDGLTDANTNVTSTVATDAVNPKPAVKDNGGSKEGDSLMRGDHEQDNGGPVTFGDGLEAANTNSTAPVATAVCNLNTSIQENGAPQSATVGTSNVCPVVTITFCEDGSNGRGSMTEGATIMAPQVHTSSLMSPHTIHQDPTATWNNYPDPNLLQPPQFVEFPYMIAHANAMMAQAAMRQNAAAAIAAARTQPQVAPPEMIIPRAQLITLLEELGVSIDDVDEATQAVCYPDTKDVSIYANTRPVHPGHHERLCRRNHRGLRQVCGQQPQPHGHPADTSSGAAPNGNDAPASRASLASHRSACQTLGPTRNMS
jgi:hypothetical protein